MLTNTHTRYSVYFDRFQKSRTNFTVTLIYLFFFCIISSTSLRLSYLARTRFSRATDREGVRQAPRFGNDWPGRGLGLRAPHIQWRSSTNDTRATSVSNITCTQNHIWDFSERWEETPQRMYVLHTHICTQKHSWRSNFFLLRF